MKASRARNRATSAQAGGADVTAARLSLVTGVEHIPLLDGSECERVARQVMALREHWRMPALGLPFYTLGAASYLDSGEGAKRARYYEKAASLNPILEREFKWLYDRLLKALGERLGAPVAFEPRAGRPGFNIYLAHELFKRPLARRHFDLQYQNLDWNEDAGIDFTRPLSYTLPLQLPRAGAGLATWDIAKADYDRMDEAQRARLDKECPPRHVEYCAGEFICHSGLLLHQVAPARPEMYENDIRLTLQGHALPGRNGYLTYW